ncbi:hypothetical protein Acid345_1909 [Candidatus Koribacter versatilis Ellin345]|uniref:Uncharacterized protein n=1 Tax=Koribacter versatilis (strain Ellin345) TaxID=204669 RepID=Q1IQE0_KORVE|nr:hypothetical protein [Candidatus Koribacter versatilis]ABF40910.1 hypothetical protein Acid345_1909 [Candidatus Koribacter versatilis Ellin345]
MKKHLVGFCLAASLCGLAVAQNAAPATSSQQEVVPRLIRFSGQLKDDAGKAMSGTVGITFTLHKTQNDNAALWIETQNVKLDSEGKYTVLLGSTKSTGVAAELFISGEAQWLGVRVEGKAEQPRVLMVSVPYALKAKEAETLAGHSATEFVTSDKLTTVVKEQMQQNGATVKKDGTGVKGNVLSSTATNFTDTTTNQVVLVTQKGTGAALSTTSPGASITAYSTGANTAANALYAQAVAPSGNAVYGNETAATGTGAGVLGRSLSVSGYGVYGVNAATTGTAVGIRGTSASSGGIGVYGTETATTGTATGIYGTTASPAGFGMEGINLATTGSAVGGFARSASTSGVGLRGYASSATGTTTGVLAQVASSSGTAAILQNTASGALLQGQSGSGLTTVFSIDGSGNFNANGEFFSPNSLVNVGWGYFAPTPLNFYAMEAISTSNASGHPTAIIKNNDNTNAGSQALEVDGPGFGGQCTIDVSGNLFCTGTLAPVIAGPNGQKTALYTMQTTENLMEDFGRGALVNGVAKVTIDPKFATAVNAGDYHVYVTPGGDCEGLFITNRTATSFEVHELRGGKSAISFDYRIVAHRKGFETDRMPDVTQRLARKSEIEGQTEARTRALPPAEPQK